MKLIAITLTSLSMLTAPVFADTASELPSIYNKKLYIDKKGNFVRVKKNGKIDGKFGADKISGNWEMRDGLFCRTVKLGKSKPGTACQTISVKGNNVVFTDKKGSKRKPRTYTLKKPK